MDAGGRGVVTLYYGGTRGSTRTLGIWLLRFHVQSYGAGYTVSIVARVEYYADSCVRAPPLDVQRRL